LFPAAHANSPRPHQTSLFLIQAVSARPTPRPSPHGHEISLSDSDGPGSRSPSSVWYCNLHASSFRHHPGRGVLPSPALFECFYSSCRLESFFLIHYIMTNEKSTSESNVSCPATNPVGRTGAVPARTPLRAASHKKAPGSPASARQKVLRRSLQLKCELRIKTSADKGLAWDMGIRAASLVVAFGNAPT